MDNSQNITDYLNYYLLQFLFFDVRDPMSQFGTKIYIVNQSRVNSGQAQKVAKHDAIMEGHMKVQLASMTLKSYLNMLGLHENHYTK